MAKKPILAIKTPVGDLNWVFITGDGKEDLNGNARYSASVYFNNAAEAEPFKKELLAFWEANKPKGSTKAKSIGVYQEVKVLGEVGKLSQKSVTQVLDPEEFAPTGRIIVSAWTGTTMPDGKSKKVKTYNAKGAEVALGERVIGPGSRGRLAVAAQVYENGPNKGLSLYLNGIQLTKFVELTGGVDFEEVDEDGWTGDDLNDDGMGAIDEPTAEVSTDAPARKVKL
jgi:hypothetical protein